MGMDDFVLVNHHTSLNPPPRKGVNKWHRG